MPFEWAMRPHKHGVFCCCQWDIFSVWVPTLCDAIGPKDTDSGCLADVTKPLEIFAYLQECVAALSLKSFDQETGEGGWGGGRAANIRSPSAFSIWRWIDAPVCEVIRSKDMRGWGWMGWGGVLVRPYEHLLQLQE